MFKSEIKGWRTGQYIFNFIQFLYQRYNNSDTFHLTNEEMEKLEKEFIKKQKV